MFKYKLLTKLKSLTQGKNTLDAIWKIIYTAVGCISSVFSLAVLLNDLVGFDRAESLCKKHWGLLVVFGVLISLIINHDPISCRGSKEDDDLIIDIKVNNLFDVSATSYVIPTNSYFRTIMDDEYISANSVQGAFQNKYFKNNLPELDRLLDESLKQQNLQIVDEQDKFGTVKRYPIGTVAKINHKNKHFYFVAINDVNEYGKPVNQSYNNVNFAFNGLFEAIKKFGHCDDLAIPLIGTGKAAIRDATIDKVVQDTIDCFLNTNDKIVENLTICISPKDYYMGKVSIDKIAKYLKYRCEFEE